MRASGLVTIAEPGECPLRSVSFEMIEGEIFGVAGIDGNGQKHLAEAISGQRKLQRGELYLGADSISQMSGKSLGDRVQVSSDRADGVSGYGGTGHL